MDFTVIEGVSILAVLDLATRQCVIHQVKLGSHIPFNTADVIEVLSAVFEVRHPQLMIHTDSGGQFASTEYTRFLKRNNIIASTGKQNVQPHHNQCIERFNKTLKQYTRKALKERFNLKTVPHKTDLLRKLEVTGEVFAFLNGVINKYNNQPHSTLDKASPNVMEAALHAYPTATPDQLVPQLARKGTLEANDIELVKAAAIEHYGKDWLRFFIEWRIKAEMQHQETIDRLNQGFDDTKQSFEETNKQVVVQADRVIDEQRCTIGHLEGELEELKSKLSYIQQREFQRELQERTRAERQTQRLARTRKPARDAATHIEYETAAALVIEDTRCTPFTRARDLTALLLLYITGMRVSNLLHINAGHLRTLLEGELLSIPAVKTKEVQYIKWPVTGRSRALAQERCKEIGILCQDKEQGHLVFTAEGGTEAINRDWLTKRVNKILKRVSALLSRKVTSHSFRIGKTTDLIEVAGIVNAQALIGHKDIQTTAIYNRSKLTEKQTRQYVEAAERRQGKGTPKRVYKKREPTY